MPGGISILMWKVAVAALINASSKVTWVRVGVQARRVSLVLLTNTRLDVMPKHRSFCYKENVNTNATFWIDVMQQKQKRKSCTHASLQLLDVLQEVPEERGAPPAPFRARGAHRGPRGCAPGDHQYDQQQTAGHTCTQTEGPVRANELHITKWVRTAWFSQEGTIAMLADSGNLNCDASCGGFIYTVSLYWVGDSLRRPPGATAKRKLKRHL